MTRYHLTLTGVHAGRTLCGVPRLPGRDRHAAYNGALSLAPYDVLVADGCCTDCARLWTDVADETDKE